MLLSGLSHALTPLAAAAAPLVHVLEAPTRFLDALWLPYRRDAAEFKTAIAAAGSVKAVFGHADVVRLLVEQSLTVEFLTHLVSAKPALLCVFGSSV